MRRAVNWSRPAVVTVWLVGIADAAYGGWIQAPDPTLADIHPALIAASVLMLLLFFPFFAWREKSRLKEQSARYRLWTDARFGAGAFDAFVGPLRPWLLFGACLVAMGLAGAARLATLDAPFVQYLPFGCLASGAVGFAWAHRILRRVDPDES